MSGNRLSKGFLLGLGSFALAAGLAQATPVQPDVKKLLAEPQARPMHFSPARAGWQGPEGWVSEANLNPLLRSVTPAAQAKAMRASLLQVMIPDPKILAAILVLIIILRRYWQRKLAVGGPQLMKSASPEFTARTKGSSSPDPESDKGRVAFLAR